VTQVTVVWLTTVTAVAAVPPKVTPSVPSSEEPVMVTSVPPAREPLTGAMPVMFGVPS